jgi:hypothetical protein
MHHALAYLPAFKPGSFRACDFSMPRPWISHDNIAIQGYGEAINKQTNVNPAPLMLRNGSAIIAYCAVDEANYGEGIGLAMADDPVAGPYNKLGGCTVNRLQGCTTSSVGVNTYLVIIATFYAALLLPTTYYACLYPWHPTTLGINDRPAQSNDIRAPLRRSVPLQREEGVPYRLPRHGARRE